MLNKIKGLGRLFGKSWGITQPRNMGDVVTLDRFTHDLFTQNNYRDLARAGYIKNVISNTCISKTADAIATIQFDVLINGTSIEDSNNRLAQSFKSLIMRPSPDECWQQFIKSVVVSRYLDGNAYIFPQESELYNEAQFIENMRPDRVEPIGGSDCRVYRYEYNRGSFRKVFERDDDGYFDLIHWKEYNPLDDIDGLSAVKPAGLNIDQVTGANRWNKQILDNGGKLTGLISIQGEDSSASMSQDEIENLYNKFKEKLQGDNGGIGIINSAAKFEPMNLTASQMDWLEGIKANAISIATSYDYPPFLLGLESTTYNNQAEAKMDLYEGSAIPKAQELYGLISAYYSRKLGVEVEFKLDLESIVALAPRMIERSKVCLDLFNGGITSLNESRKKVGLEEIPGGDDIFVDKNNTPMFGAPES